MLLSLREDSAECAEQNTSRNRAVCFAPIYPERSMVEPTQSESTQMRKM